MIEHYTSTPISASPIGISIHYFLAELSAKIRLTSSHREKAEGHYQAVAEVLKNSPPGTLLNKLDVQMIPFGGLGTRTASKPYLNDEFDLDLIVRFAAKPHHFPAAADLFDEVFDRLSSLPRYEDKLERMARCIRVNFSGEFHLDLMPAIPVDDAGESTKLWVPEKNDRGIFTFEQVDPIGLMQWFEKRTEIRVQKSFVLNERADFEAMPILSDDAKKSPLRQSVQLIKRMRDKFFENDEDSKKILKSVVVLTVAAQVFSGEQDLYLLIDRILAELDVKTMDLSSSSVWNPVHPEEDFLEPLRRRPDRHEKLRKFVTSSRKSWRALGIQQQGIPKMTKELEAVFGEDVAGTVVREYATKMDELYKRSRMTMSATGVLGVASSTKANIPLQRHQFFGDEF